MENQEKLKKKLQTYLKTKGISVKLDEIKHTGSWHEGEFWVGKRIYHVDDLKCWDYGPDWYKYHEYTDIGNYRISMSYHFYGLHSEKRSLSIGCENVFTWSKKTAYYKKMTNAQMDKIVDNYVKEYIKNGCPGNADVDMLRTTIKHELSKSFLKNWWDK